MTTDDFSFDLPEDLIAQVPAQRRDASRLMVLDRIRGTRTHSMVASLPDFVEPGTLMVFNDSRVRKARLPAKAIDTGSEVEFLLLDRYPDGSWEVLCSRASRQRPGRRYRFPAGVEGLMLEPWAPADGHKVEGRGESRRLAFEPPIDEAWLELHGHIPLPPYIHRGDDAADAERYQTVYARNTGSAAAPTAGLHFTTAMLEALEARGIECAWVTLHVGLGTFLPVRTHTIEEHRMHEEVYTISESTALAISKARSEGRPILAVGTTSLRTLESAWTGEGLAAGQGRTSIFIYPGYRFRAVDRLFTNFHTPRSTLLMLVSAFAGRDFILESYREAVGERYRFFSYGDAMLIR